MTMSASRLCGIHNDGTNAEKAETRTSAETIRLLTADNENSLTDALSNRPVCVRTHLTEVKQCLVCYIKCVQNSLPVQIIQILLPKIFTNTKHKLLFLR